MKTSVVLRKYLAKFFVQWEKFQTEVVEISKHPFYFQNIFMKIEPFMRRFEQIW
jgi:hypothetical protein